MITEVRFEFGKNWQNFISLLDESHIETAERSLKEMLGLSTLEGKSFLDVGSGSGLFSLAAMRLGAERVHSFDYDPQSVACTKTLRERYFPEAKEQWVIEQGSILDANYVLNLKSWDVVYSWGVLHHTGDMWQALENVVPLVDKSGKLFISIYNDQGLGSVLWKRVKRFYNRGAVPKVLASCLFIPYFVLVGLLSDIAKMRNPIRRYKMYERGMSAFYDWFDWLGGYPFEVAKPEEIFDFYCQSQKGFQLERMKTCGGKIGCNQFVFVKQ